MAEISPEEIAAKLPELRQKVQDKSSGGDYDARDVDHFVKDDKFAAQFLKTYKTAGDVQKAAELADTVLKFRKEWEVNDQSFDKFPEEYQEQLFFKGVGIKGHKIMHFKVKKHKKGHNVEQVKKFIALRFNEHYMATPDQKLIVMFDFNGAGLSNMDLDVTKFIISCLSTYFPACCENLLMFEMPFLLEAIWKVIKAWLDENQKKAVTFVKKGDIQEYIDESNLEPHMIKKK